MPRVTRAIALAVVLAVCAACTPQSIAGRPARGHLTRPASYYLALGDSLSRGVQPNAAGASVPTASGYADQLYALLRVRYRGLRLVKLGCNGETTSTMIAGGLCRYRAGSQLATALAFLRAHRVRVSLITLDIGANDPDSCVSGTTLVSAGRCVGINLRRTAVNLSQILSRIRAVDPGVKIIAMNYYLPALAQWRSGLMGHGIARVSELAAAAYNGMLTGIYHAYGVRVADVFGAFRTADFDGRVSLPGLGVLPPNVAAICRWTWECAGPPRGPNQHANQAGYAVIARAFLAASG